MIFDHFFLKYPSHIKLTVSLKHIIVDVVISVPHVISFFKEVSSVNLVYLWKSFLFLSITKK